MQDACVLWVGLVLHVAETTLLVLAGPYRKGMPD